MPGDPVTPFVLADGVSLPGLRSELRKRGFAVRRGDTFPGLGAAWVRIAVRNPDVTEALLATLAEIRTTGDAR